MITASQINLSQSGQQQSSVLDARQIRVQNRSGGTAAPGEGRELVLSREARYRYQAQDQLAYASAGRVQGQDGSQSQWASAAVAQRTSDVLLEGRSALQVGRSALGDGPGVGTGGSARLEASRYTFVSQSESRQIAASGQLELATGETVGFSIALSQQQTRQYEVSESVRIEERAMTDPLVINFGSPSAQLRDTVFEFDLDGDGEKSEFATLGPGSGYLVLDRNGNEQVDEGRELFGPASGSGFSELAALDEDGNRWVDANDPVFDQLQVMVQSADGAQELRSLKEVGVQALYAGSVSDQYTLTSAQGVPLGEIKATGLYLSENGTVRTMEELDLARQNEASAPPQTEVLARGDDRLGGGDTRPVDDARIQSIREALEKLQTIRERQEAFIEEQSRTAESDSPMDRFMNQVDRLRRELLEEQQRKRTAAEQYQTTEQTTR
ncbi:hypothetical protein C8D92_103145 [Tamilnaduibacter salinus]|uniref:VCBS repeat-containing protein n=1 Tax=Tamilnaduibacter salinus TaxID=1484056 RepID=A0A2U1CYA0_9GAMM|nr:hypothetical protein [Tamilnaduibacter salinus]PVY77459.1 hypothetical protein C8D92_103145 [Tamilnaduibacter salinus]